jgi:hypothetical protein
MDATAFNEYMTDGHAAASFGFVDGYWLTYDCGLCSDFVSIALVELASAAATGQLIDAITYPTPDMRTSHYPGIPGAFEVDAVKADQGAYEHEIVAAKGPRVMIIDGWTASPRLPTPFHQLADRQYASLKP